MAPQRSRLNLPPFNQIHCVLKILGSASVSEGNWKFGEFQFPAAANVRVFQKDGLQQVGHTERRTSFPRSAYQHDLRAS